MECKWCSNEHAPTDLCRARRVNRRMFLGVFAAGVGGMLIAPNGQWSFDPLAARAEAMTIAAFRAASGASIWHTHGQSAAEAFSSKMTPATEAIFERSIIERAITKHRGDVIHLAGMWRFDGGYARLCPSAIPDLDPAHPAYSPSARLTSILTRD